MGVVEQAMLQLIDSSQESADHYRKKAEQLESENQKIKKVPEKRGNALQGQSGHNVNQEEENAVTDSTISLNEVREQDQARKVPTIKIQKIVTVDYEIDLKRVLSERADEDDEIWGKIYDVGESELVWMDEHPELEHWQRGFWMGILFKSKNGNWFLYTEASATSKENVYGGKEGKNIYPFDELESFEWLEEKKADVEVFEKYFPEKIEEA